MGSSADSSTGKRFHPLLTDAIRPVPTKYLADHPNGAFAEVLMRVDRAGSTLTRVAIDGHHVSQLALRRTLTVADLTAPAPGGLLDALLRRGPGAYVQLRSIASAIHREHPGLSGLIWQGYQLGVPGMTCVMLYGDRVSEADLDEIAVHGLGNGLGYRLMRDAARLRDALSPEDLAAGAHPDRAGALEGWERAVAAVLVDPSS